MGEKDGGDQKKGDGGKKEERPITVVLKVDMHCDCLGCTKKVERAVGAVIAVDGVHEVKYDCRNKKLTVVGKVDPEKIRRMIEDEIEKKKVVLVSTRPNKEKDGGDQKKGDGGNKEERPIRVVLKVDMHCDCLGCAKKFERAVSAVRAVDGVHEVKYDSRNKKLKVLGKVDPEKIRQMIEDEIEKKVVLFPRKKVTFVFPLPNKDTQGGVGGEKKADAKNKPKEHVVSTVVLKIKLHGKDHIDKIKRIIDKSAGVEVVAVDPPKDLVTVKGTMDAKTLTEYLKVKLKRAEEIVQPKKDDGGGDKKGSGGGKKKDKGGEKEEKVAAVVKRKMEHII